jgi:hypothetical protein
MIMNPKRYITSGISSLLAVVIVVTLMPGDTLAYLSSSQPAVSIRFASQDEASRIPPGQLNSLVAPIALFPDPLLAQVLAASTYPLEIIQLQQWLARNSALKDQALADAAEKETWDPSVQALAALPDVVKRLADDIQWTTDLGNAFLAQESDLMDAVQRMRKKAQDSGNLKSGEQQIVETKVIETKTVIVIEQANPQVVYVPSYNPVVVWGPPIYAYPRIYYPPPGYYGAGIAISFGAGVAMGAWWGGGWGWGPSWGRNNITINNNNNFIRNSNIRNGNISGANGGNRWQHRPEHRGGAPYRDRSTADRFGGATRGDSLANRQANARQQLGRQGGTLPSNRPGGAGISDRASGGVGNRANGAGVSNRAGAGSGVSNRPSGAGGGASSRAAGGSVSNRASTGGTDRVGNRNVPRSDTSGGNRNAFGGGSQGYNGSSARANGNRGASSAQSRGSGANRSGNGGGGARRR